MRFEQILTPDLGCAAYVVGCEQAGEAVVVDPPLDVAPVLEACRRHGLRLVGVIETHTHADHVSGHGVLAASGAWIAVHRLAGAAYEHRPLEDGDRIELGTVAVDVLHTPGHRPEHCCLAVSDRSRADEPWLLLSGDSLFVGDVARPDLAVEGAEGAAELFRSLHERLGALPDGVEVYPGHVAGSLCGRSMSAKGSTTLGFERRFNPMLAAMTVAEFVARATTGLAEKPPTTARCVALNRGPLLTEPPRARLVDDVGPDHQVLDVRDPRCFADGHLPGSVNVPLADGGFATRAAFVLEAERPVVVVADGAPQAEAAARRLAAVGFLELAELAGGLARAERPLERFAPIGVDDLAAGAADGSLQVVDVREASEQDELVPGALVLPYRLAGSADLAALDRSRPVATVCQSGARAAVAASLLAARGYDVRPVLGGGMAGWRDASARTSIST